MTNTITTEMCSVCNAEFLCVGTAYKTQCTPICFACKEQRILQQNGGVRSHENNDSGRTCCVVGACRLRRGTR